MNVTKALLASDPAERQHYEDQITVNLWARKILCGNSAVVVIEDPATGQTAGCRASEIDLVETRAAVAESGYRLILGSELFTARDNPRPYRASRS